MRYSKLPKLVAYFLVIGFATRTASARDTKPPVITARAEVCDLLFFASDLPGTYVIGTVDPVILTSQTGDAGIKRLMARFRSLVEEYAAKKRDKLSFTLDDLVQNNMPVGVGDFEDVMLFHAEHGTKEGREVPVHILQHTFVNQLDSSKVYRMKPLVPGYDSPIVVLRHSGGKWTMRTGDDKHELRRIVCLPPRRRRWIVEVEIDAGTDGTTKIGSIWQGRLEDAINAFGKKASPGFRVAAYKMTKEAAVASTFGGQANGEYGQVESDGDKELVRREEERVKEYNRTHPAISIRQYTEEPNILLRLKVE